MTRKEIPSKLKLKLHSIMKMIAKGTTPGERNAARTVATKILRKHGWTLKEFISTYYPDNKLKAASKGTVPQPNRRRIFERFSLKTQEGRTLFFEDARLLMAIVYQILLVTKDRATLREKIFIAGFLMIILASIFRDFL